MRVVSTQTLILAQASARRDFRSLYAQMAGDIGRSVLLYTPAPDKPVSPTLQNAFLASAGQLVMRYFVGVDGRSPYAEDGITPLAPFPRLLNKALYTAARLPVYAQRNWLKRHMPADLFDWLADTPGSALAMVREDDDKQRRVFLNSVKDLRVFDQQPTLTYDSAHTWVDPHGYRLSDRIWKNGVDTRAKMDAMLSDMIRRRKSALEISKAAEAYLLPGRKGLRTTLPYGRDASFHGMRLARTEISRAHNYAVYASAASNPYAEGIDLALSPAHPRSDICDSLATLDQSASRLRDPYPMDSPQIAPIHVLCLCRNTVALVENPALVSARLRQAMQTAMPLDIAPNLSPAAGERLVQALVGSLIRGV